MSSREEQSGRFRAEPDVASATGGHLAPERGAGSLFDPLNEPLPSEVAARSGPSDETQAIPQATPPETRRPRVQEPEPSVPRRRAARKKVPMRRVRRTLKHVHPLSVLKLSGFFYVCFLVAWLVFVAIVYQVLNSFGLFEGVSNFCKSMKLSTCRDEIGLATVERVALVVGLLIGIVGTLLNTLMAVLYNVGADILGGLELTFVERDGQP